MERLIEDIRDGRGWVALHRLLEVLMEMLATPFCSVFTSMTVKDGKESLPVNLIERGNEGMRIFHEPSRALGMSNCTCILEILRPAQGWIRLAIIELGDLDDTDWGGGVFRWHYWEGTEGKIGTDFLEEMREKSKRDCEVAVLPLTDVFVQMSLLA